MFSFIHLSTLFLFLSVADVLAAPIRQRAPLDLSEVFSSIIDQVTRDSITTANPTASPSDDVNTTSETSFPEELSDSDSGAFSATGTDLITIISSQGGSAITLAASGATTTFGDNTYVVEPTGTDSESSGTENREGDSAASSSPTDSESGTDSNTDSTSSTDSASESAQATSTESTSGNSTSSSTDSSASPTESDNAAASLRELGISSSLAKGLFSVFLGSIAGAFVVGM